MRRSLWLWLVVFAAGEIAPRAYAQGRGDSIRRTCQGLRTRRKRMPCCRWAFARSLGRLAQEQAADRNDLYGDPLPAGAVARVGSLRYLIGLGSSNVAFSPDGKAITATSIFWRIPLRLWEIETGRVLRSLPQLADRAGVACAVAFSADGKWLAAGDHQGRVRVGEADTGRKRYEVAVPVGGISSLLFSADSKVLATGDSDSTVWGWEVATGRMLWRVDVGDWIWPLALGHDGKTLASGKWEGRIALIDVTSGRERRRLLGHSGHVTCLAFAPDGQRLASAGEDGTLRYWDAESGRELRRFTTYRLPDGNSEDLHDQIAFSPDGKRLVAGDAHHNLSIWDLEKGQVYRRFPGSTFEGGFAFSPDGKLLASGGARFRLWDVERGLEIRRYPNTDGLHSVAFSPDGKTLVTGDRLSAIRLWDTSRGQELRGFTGHEGGVFKVAFSPDGRRVGSAGDDGTVRLWDTATGRELLCVPRQDQRLLGLAFAPDGKTLAAGGEEGIVQVFDVTTGAEVRQFETSLQGGISQSRLLGRRQAPGPVGQRPSSSGTRPGASGSILWSTRTGPSRSPSRRTARPWPREIS